MNKRIVLFGPMNQQVFGFREDLIKTLLEKGYDVFVISTEDHPKIGEKLESMGVNYKTTPFSRRGMNPLTDILNSRKLADLLRKINPDIVLSYMAKPVIWGAIAGKMAKVKNSFGMLEGLGFFFTEQPSGIPIKTRIVRQIQKLLYKIALPRLKGLILLNQDDYKDLIIQSNIPIKSHYILGGIGLDIDKYPYSSAPINPLSFIFIGRLLTEKGIFEFIDAAKKIKKSFPDVKFIVLGSPDPQNPGSIKGEYIEQLRKDSIIEAPGVVSNVNEWLQESSVFVLPSYREGAPRSTQEAMSIGRAVITTDVPGCRDTVIDGINGYLIPKWDSNALAQAMRKMIENPQQIIEMGKESRRMAEEKYDSKIVNQKLIDYLHS